MTAKPGAERKVGTTPVVESQETSSAMFDFIRKDLRFFFPLNGAKEALIEDEAFLLNALKGACEKAAYRNAGENNALPDSGVVDLALFIKTVKGFAFRGEEKPNKEDKREAADFLKKLETKAVTPVQMAGWFAKKGYPIPDLEAATLETAFMRMRMDKAEAERAKKEAELLEMEG